jgi:hypothetical protein
MEENVAVYQLLRGFAAVRSPASAASNQSLRTTGLGPEQFQKVLIAAQDFLKV